MSIASVGLWIDQSRAVIVFAKSLTAHLVESRPYNPTRFYDNVITALGAPGPVLITGPGETKTELQEHMEHTARRNSWVVEIKPSSCTSNREILAELAERLQPQ
jgi:hypothetical protein